MRLLWFVIGALCAAAAVEGTRWALRTKAESERARPVPTGAGARSAAMAPGHDFEGEPLPAKDERQQRNATPLNLRRSCAWGVPGANPYRGTVEQALVAAQLPTEVVKKISEMADRGWTHGQVEISRDGIRTVDRRRYFGTRASMAFGGTMCFDTRVNFKPGHVEYAAYYEAADNRGQTYSVMVPYVCQNVAVLGERYEEGEHNGHSASAPATWSALLLALSLLGWRQRRRSRPRQR